MTPAEAADLLARCAAFDNRKPSLVAAQAWANALNETPLDADCFAAVDRFYGMPPEKPGERLWIQPHDVRTHRKIIRSERLANFVYEPPPDGGPDPGYRRRLKGQLDAVASGRASAPTAPPALTGGPHPDLERVLDGFGQEVPDVDDAPEVAAVKRPGPLGIVCPKC
uniref:hypothetical protein n=1 Tax=Streptomyces phytophilus TaxID=722715 RepID=UPI001C6937BA